MSEVERIRDQLRRAFHGEAWHGPSVREVLDGVTAKQAASRPFAGGHSIWELVHHITAWTEISRRRLAEDRVPEATAEEDWPPVDGADEESWRKDLHELFASQERLQELLKSFPEPRLEATVPGQAYTFYVMLHGAVQHGLYHAGQVAILKKAKA